MGLISVRREPNWQGVASILFRNGNKSGSISTTTDFIGSNTGQALPDGSRLISVEVQNPSCYTIVVQLLTVGGDANGQYKAKRIAANSSRKFEVGQLGGNAGIVAISAWLDPLPGLPFDALTVDYPTSRGFYLKFFGDFFTKGEQGE